MIKAYTMNSRSVVLFICCFLLFSCSGKKVYSEGNPELKVRRFDTALYNYLKGTASESDLSGYSDFMTIFGSNIIYIGKADSTGFDSRLKSFFSEPTLMGLYADEQSKFADIGFIDEELTPAFEALLKEFPALKQPRIYMHVSGLNQNVIVTDDALSISADKYLGSDYPLYKEFYYDYQLQNMTPERIVPDYLLGYMMADFSFKGDGNVLLDRMLYEGKLRYILSRILPERPIWECMAYTQDQYQWCSDNHSRIWKSILHNNQLYDSNHLIVSQYLNDAPHTTSLPPESPGRVGVWIGFQIINSYMKHNPETTLQELMNKTNAQELLKQAKYKP